MLKFAQTKMRFKTSFISKKQQLITEIKNHPAWKGDISLIKAATLLQGNSPFTYVLSSGMDENHFFLSFIDFNYVVRHKNVRVLIYDGEWRVKNGGSTSYESIVSLIPNCLHCSVSVCKPLS